MAKLIDITGKALSGEWGTDDEAGTGIPVLRTTNFTNNGVVDYSNVVTRTIKKKNLEEKFLRKGDIIIEKSGGSDKQPVGRVIYFDGSENTYLFNNFTGLLRVKNQNKWLPRYIFYSLFSNYRSGGTRAYENKTTGLHNLKTDDYVTRYEVVEADMSHQIAVCELLDKISAVVSMRQQELQKMDELVKARFVEMISDTKSVERLDSLIVPYKAERCGKCEFPVLSITMHDGLVLQSERFKKVIASNDKSQYKVVPYNKLVVAFPIDEGLLSAQRVVEIGIVSPAYNIYSIDEKKVHPLVLEYILRSDKSIQYYLSKLRGTTLRRRMIPKDDFNSMPIDLPTMDRQKQFLDELEQIDKSKLTVQKALNEAQVLFDSLMQEYFG